MAVAALVTALCSPKLILFINTLYLRAMDTTVAKQKAKMSVSSLQQVECMYAGFTKIGSVSMLVTLLGNEFHNE